MAVTVDELLREPFVNRTRKQKEMIIMAGKPRPKLENLISLEKEEIQLSSADGCENYNNNKFAIVFDVASYDHVEWMTGCNVRQALFCWTCLLFRSAEKSSWNYIGIDNLCYLAEKIKLHESCLSHIQSMLDLQLFASSIASKSTTSPEGIENIERNREMAKRIIDVIYYIVTQQKCPRTGSRDRNTLEVEDCLENLHFLRDYDLAQINLLDETMKKIQTNPKIIADMVDAITRVVKTTIQKELHQSTYVSLILSEHSTDRTKSQISTVLRYLKNGEVCERFVGFTNTDGAKTSNSIVQHINKVITDFQISRRIIAYSFDGFMLATMQPLYEVKQELQYCYPYIFFVPCHFHDLDYVLQKSLSFTRDFDLFFKNIMTVGSCFQEGSNLYSEFIAFVCAKSNCAAGDSSFEFFFSTPVKRCSYDTVFLNSIKTHRLSIVDFFDHVLRSHENLSEIDVVRISGLRTFLADFKTVFLLETFIKLFDLLTPLVEALKNPAPGLAFDTNLIESVVKSIDEEIENSTYEIIWNRVAHDFDELKKMDLGSTSKSTFTTKYSCQKLFLDIAQCMKNQVNYRLENVSKLSFCRIFDLESSAKELNSDYVQTLITNYGQTFNYTLLDKEIKLVAVNKSAMNSESVQGLYKFFFTSGLGSSFTNLNKLCEIVLALPSMVINTDSAKTKLDDINSWSYVPGKHEFSRDITLLCVEQDYLKELRNKKSFHDDMMVQFQEINKTLKLRDYLKELRDKKSFSDEVINRYQEKKKALETV